MHIPNMQILSSASRAVSDCVRVQGEVFVEVSAEGFAPYREILMVKANIMHQVLLIPLLKEDNIREPSIPNVEIPEPEVLKLEYPMPMQTKLPQAFQQVQGNTSVELCVTTEPADAYLRINGIKRKSGTCMSVQNAAEVSVEAAGYHPYKQLLSIPPTQTEALQHQVVLKPIGNELDENHER